VYAWLAYGVSKVHAAYVTTGTAVPAGTGVSGTVAATDAGAGVATGADGEPVHPALLIAIMSRIIVITADFNDRVPQLLSEAITIAFHIRVL